jgi:hypothetical protein
MILTFQPCEYELDTVFKKINYERSSSKFLITIITRVYLRRLRHYRNINKKLLEPVVIVA